jgi:mRNA-degrading endonuclease toxin of MazEF toxin-antitoxin module
MKLTRWDIVFVPVDENDKVGHPAVILSPEDILEDARQLRVNALVGTKRVPAGEILPHNVLLNGADGLEFQTLVNCAVVFMVRKKSILRHAGRVSYLRRAEIQKKVRAALGLS